HAHDVDIDVVEVVALRMAIAADRFARDDASQAGFLLGFTDRRLTRLFALVNRAFWENPTLAGRARDHRHLQPPLPDSIRDHRRLVYTRHRSSGRRWSGVLCAVNPPPRGCRFESFRRPYQIGERSTRAVRVLRPIGPGLLELGARARADGRDLCGLR